MSRWSWPVRWAVPAVLVVLLALTPWAVGRWQARPAAGTADVSASEVLARVQAARATPWSGLAETRGGLALPVTDVFSDLVDLAGSTATARAWWSGPLAWRVDQLNPVGEIDTIRDPGGSWQWDYQKARATFTPLAPDIPVRLPQLADLLPPTLGARLLSEARPDEASRLPGREIAGRDTLGLRIRPAESASTVDHVDVWADVATGVPLRVDVVGRGASLPAMSSTFLDVDLTAPTQEQVTFTPPAGAEVRRQTDPGQADLVNAVNVYSRVRPPDTLAGLDRSDRTPGLGAVGVYGRGVTELVAVPLLERFAGGVRAQLADAATVDPATGRLTLGVGPLNLLVTTSEGGGRFWLLAGTVTPQTLQTAADQLATYGGFDG
ncbi:transcriptional regulator [Jatrophihabitans sp. YIM 134969]